jgi:hypothetical protein
MTALRRWSAAVVFGLALSGCGRSGQRLLHARIEQAGKPALETRFGIPDRWDKKEAWRELEGRSFTAAPGWSPPAADGKSITLHGKSQIIFDHAKRPFATADVDDLVLEIEPGAAGSWRIPKSEIERTLKSVK